MTCLRLAMVLRLLPLGHRAVCPIRHPLAPSHCPPLDSTILQPGCRTPEEYIASTLALQLIGTSDLFSWVATRMRLLSHLLEGSSESQPPTPDHGVDALISLLSRAARYDSRWLIGCFLRKPIRRWKSRWATCAGIVWWRQHVAHE